VVRGIYRDFIYAGFSEAEIAARLNERGVLTDMNRPWTRGAIHQILVNEKYIGNNVWNRQSFKLKQRRVQNEPELWIRSDHAFEAIIDVNLFRAAQEIIQSRSRRLTDADLLQVLRGLLSSKGCLSGLIIDESPNIPSSSTYQSRFGSLLRAYELIGYHPGRDYRFVEENRQIRRMYPSFVENVIARIERVGGSVLQDGGSDLLRINSEFTASVVMARCSLTTAGSMRWIVRFDRSLCPDVTIAVRMNDDNSAPLDYFILPSLDMDRMVLRIREHNGLTLDSYRFDSLDRLFEMAERAQLREVASC
jgi:hypothetical protein